MSGYKKEDDAKSPHDLAQVALRWAKKVEPGRTRLQHLETIWFNFCHDLAYAGIDSFEMLCWYDTHGATR